MAAISESESANRKVVQLTAENIELKAKVERLERKIIDLKFQLKGIKHADNMNIGAVTQNEEKVDNSFVSLIHSMSIFHAFCL